MDSIYDIFKQYLHEKGIFQVSDFDKKDMSVDENTSEEGLLHHLSVLSRFHRVTMGFTGCAGQRFDNSTGKKLEEYKVYLKRFIRDLKKISSLGPENNFERILMDFGEAIVARGEASIKEIYDSDYYGLLNRSMKRTEICIGNSDQSNVRGEEIIEIVNIKHCTYNMVECDGIYFLGRLKRCGMKLDWMRLIKCYCDYEELDGNSERYIAAMLSYPYEFLKCFNRYKYKKKDWSIEKYETRLLKAIEKDGDSIIKF